MVAKSAAREFNNKTKGKKSDKHLYFSMGGQTDKNIKGKQTRRIHPSPYGKAYRPYPKDMQKQGQQANRNSHIHTTDNHCLPAFLHQKD